MPPQISAKGHSIERLPSARMGASASFEQSQLNVIPGEHTETQLRVRNTGSVVDQFTFEAIGCGSGVDHRRAGRDLAVPGGRGDRRRVDRRAAGVDDAAGGDAVRDPCAVAGGPDRLSRRRRRARRRGVRRPTPRAAPDAVVEQPSGPPRAGRRQPRQRADPPGVRRHRPRGSAALRDRPVGAHRRAGRGRVRDGQGAFRSSDSGAASPSGCRSRSWPPRTVTIPSRPTARCSSNRSCRGGSGRPCSPCSSSSCLLFILWKTLLEPSIESTARDSAEEVVADEVEAIDERLDAAGDPRSARRRRGAGRRGAGAASRRRPKRPRARSRPRRPRPTAARPRRRS